MTDIKLIVTTVVYGDDSIARIRIEGPGHWDRQGDQDNAAHANALAELVSNLAPNAVEINRLLDEDRDLDTSWVERNDREAEGEEITSSEWQDYDDARFSILDRLTNYLTTTEA